jgi:hypothetical protein
MLPPERLRQHSPPRAGATHARSGRRKSLPATVVQSTSSLQSNRNDLSPRFATLLRN